jgi:hypothetical protein
MEILHNNSYNNQIGVNPASFQAITQAQEAEKKKGGLSTFLDNLFWWTGKAGEVYDASKARTDEALIETDITLGEQAEKKKILGMPRTVAIVVIGAVVVISGVLIYKHFKK